MEPRKPAISNYGIYAEHDLPCAINWRKGESAVLDMNRGVFEPSWKAQRDGWRLIHANTWWKRLLVRLCD